MPCRSWTACPVARRRRTAPAWERWGSPAGRARAMVAASAFSPFTVREFGNPLNAFYEIRQ
jgi:hypothetical protein